LSCYLPISCPGKTFTTGAITSGAWLRPCAAGRSLSMAQYDEAEVRQRLEAEKIRLKQEIYRQTQGDEAVPTTDPLLDAGGVATDPADDADALADYERTQMLVSNAQEMLEDINAALARLDAGTYGICTNCGQEIDPRRLEALPWVSHCINCQAALEAESARRRP
jgi:DnaK suppressor protein